jgi:hypothetical protein
MNPSASPHYLNVLTHISLEDAYIKQVFDYYRKRFQECDWAEGFINSSGRIPEVCRNHPYPCLSDRALGRHIPSRRTFAGGAVRGSLQQSQLLLPTGSELFRGCVVFPEIDEDGNIVSATGYRFAKRIRRWQKAVIHWQKPISNNYIASGMNAIQEVIYEKARY